MKELFQKDITRPINGVVKVGQLTEAHVQEELEEYVMTRELNRYIDTFFARYVDALETPSDKIGVWVSGFFGSGKSHFLKILSYLLANREVGGKRAVDFFADKVTDPSLLASMQRAAEAPKDVILFNIDSKASANTQSDKEAIVLTFQRVFDEHLGYFAITPAIANFERRLSKQGTYQAFQQAYQQVSGEPWLRDRENWDFREDEIITALQQSMRLSESAARSFFENVEHAFDISVESFAKTVKAWLDERGPKHELIFMVDEVGQYVGENAELMLNLQTLAEDLGTYCEGRAWVVVTSQEDIDTLTQSRVRGNDFSKIQGRFATRLSLSSANTDEVIKLRLLDKTEEAEDTLRALYGAHEQSIKSAIRFSQGTAEMASYKNAEEFVRSYPFVPYQFKLLQRVFNQIRLHGASGKHLSEGERSMLDAFQIAALKLKDKPLGSIAPFHLFYDAVESFLDGGVKLIISQAADTLALFEVALLKTLFMIKYVKEIKGSLENLTTLSLSHLDEDRVALRERVQKALTRLEGETLIQRSGELFEFLTNEEQDVGREIKNFTVPAAEYSGELQKVIWSEIFTERRFRYDPRHQYPFNRALDDRVSQQQSDDLAFHLVTPLGDEYAQLKDDAAATLRSGQGSEVLVRLPDEASLEAFEELRLCVRTDRYIMQKNTPGLGANLKAILQARAEENRERRQRVRQMLEDLIVQADVFVHGSKLAKAGNTPQEVLNTGLRTLVEGAFPKLGYVKSHFDQLSHIDEVLQGGRDAVQPDVEGNVPNTLAHDEMQRWLQEQQDHYQTLTLRALENRFTRKPYGWSREDVHGVLAELLVMGKAELKRAQESVELKERELARNMMSRQGLDAHTVRVPRVVNPQSLRIAQALMKECLENPAPASDPQELYAEFQRRFKTRQENITAHRRRAEQGDYPFAKELQTYQQLLSELRQESSAAALFDTLREREDEVEEMAEESVKIESFFNSQIDLFDRTRHKLSALEADLRYINEAELLDRVEEAKRILALPDPTQEVPSLGGLLTPVEAQVKALTQARQEEAQREWQQAIKKTTAFAKDQGVADERLPKLLEPLTRLENAIQRAESIDAAIANQANVERTRQQVSNAIIEHINRQAERPHEAHAPKAKPIKVLRPASLSRKEVLESEADIEQYVARLRETLLGEFKAGNRLRIE